MMTIKHIPVLGSYVNREIPYGFVEKPGETGKTRERVGRGREILPVSPGRKILFPMITGGYVFGIFSSAGRVFLKKN